MAEKSRESGRDSSLQRTLYMPSRQGSVEVVRAAVRVVSRSGSTEVGVGMYIVVSVESVVMCVLRYI